ncbi:DNA-binding protein RFX8 isoform X2 [Eschrichtius robustus]|uniref:DNA-binding protein RFX8 isoform X2 n=1 Tax=Eschrichtius robustus TaxID=9764 RepID=UPI0035BF9EA8
MDGLEDQCVDGWMDMWMVKQVDGQTDRQLVHLVFPDLGTRRLGTRGNARYHYDGICIKKSSFFYARYCYLLGEKRYHSGDVVAFEKSANYNSILQEEGAGASRSPNKTDPVGSPLSEFRRCPFWEQELAKKYSYKTMAFLADEYCNYCQDILQNVRNQELKRVEDSLTSFWKSLQQDTVMLMSLPDVCQLLKCYDRQLYKGIEDVLLHDFLEDVSIQHLESVQSFSKKFKLWLLTALEGLPDLLQLSKRREVTVFVKRLRRKTYLSNMAKTMRTVLENSRRASLLKSDLRAIIRQGALDISEKALRSNPSGTDDLEENTEMKCLSSLISLLGTSTDLSVFLNCLCSNLQTSVFQPSRSKEELIRLAASFQLRWNFLLTAVSKAMTLWHRDSFGSWHLFHLLLLEYVIHILQSCIEEDEEGGDVGNLQEMLPDDQPLVPPDQELSRPPDPSPAQERRSPSADPHRVTLRHKSHSQCATEGSSVVVRVPGFLVDIVTGDKLIQVLLEDKATESTIRLNLPLERETLITLRDGQKFVIHVSDVSQSSENIYFRDSNADTEDYLFD